MYKAKDLPDAVDFCIAHTEKGKACIMSPAAASYNYYRDFGDRNNTGTRHYGTGARFVIAP
jgi:UDP-N-acetylmuramoylalanine--D-glutamate ligase